MHRKLQITTFSIIHNLLIKQGLKSEQEQRQASRSSFLPSIKEHVPHQPHITDHNHSNDSELSFNNNANASLELRSNKDFQEQKVQVQTEPNSKISGKSESLIGELEGELSKELSAGENNSLPGKHQEGILNKSSDKKDDGDFTFGKSNAHRQLISAEKGIFNVSEGVQRIKNEGQSDSNFKNSKDGANPHHKNKNRHKHRHHHHNHDESYQASKESANETEKDGGNRNTVKGEDELNNGTDGKAGVSSQNNNKEEMGGGNETPTDAGTDSASSCSDSHNA